MSVNTKTNPRNQNYQTSLPRIKSKGVEMVAMTTDGNSRHQPNHSQSNYRVLVPQLHKPSISSSKNKRSSNMMETKIECVNFDRADNLSSKSLNKCVSKISNNNSRPQHQLMGSSINSPNFDQIFVRTVVHMDPESEMFMKVAQRAYQEHEQSLIACKKCGRKFFPHRVEQHEAACAATAKPKWNHGTKAVGTRRGGNVMATTRKNT